MVDFPGDLATAPAAETSRFRWLLRSNRRANQPLVRVASCGVAALGPLVAAHADDSGRAGWTGATACGRWHSCPVCAPRIAVGRAKELAEVAKRNHLDNRGNSRTWLFSLTLRHEAHHSLEDLRDVLRQAWRYLSSGRRRARWHEATGARGVVRALEATHGRHGWHPHLHVMVVGAPIRARPHWTDDCMTERELRAARAHEAHEALKAFRLDFAALWLQCVRRAIDECEARALDAGLPPEEVSGRFAGMMPDLEHGAVVTFGTSAKYVAKLGWEVAGAWPKAGRQEESVSPWQMLEGSRGSTRAAKLWSEWSVAMHGQRALTWSRGLRPKRDDTDAMLALRDEAPTVAYLDRDTYRLLEAYGRAWDFARWLHVDFAAAAAWCAHWEYGLPILEKSVRFKPRERLTALQLAPRPEPRDPGLQRLDRAHRARLVAIWGMGSAPRWQRGRLQRGADALDEVARMARGEPAIDHEAREELHRLSCEAMVRRAVRRWQTAGGARKLAHLPDVSRETGPGLT